MRPVSVRKTIQRSPSSPECTAGTLPAEAGAGVPASGGIQLAQVIRTLRPSRLCSARAGGLWRQSEQIVGTDAERLGERHDARGVRIHGGPVFDFAQ